MLLEEKLEPIFHPDSYGYRPEAFGPRRVGRGDSTALLETETGCWTLMSGPFSTASRA